MEVRAGIDDLDRLDQVFGRRALVRRWCRRCRSFMPAARAIAPLRRASGLRLWPSSGKTRKATWSSPRLSPMPMASVATGNLHRSNIATCALRVRVTAPTPRRPTPLSARVPPSHGLRRRKGDDRGRGGDRATRVRHRSTEERAGDDLIPGIRVSSGRIVWPQKRFTQAAGVQQAVSGYARARDRLPTGSHSGKEGDGLVDRHRLDRAEEIARAGE